VKSQISPLVPDVLSLRDILFLYGMNAARPNKKCTRISMKRNST
jgi:hypothetical protein